MKSQTIKKLIEKLKQAKEFKKFNLPNINYVIECLNFERDKHILNAKHRADIKTLKGDYKKPKCFSIDFKELSDEKKNPGFKLSVESVLNNRKIKKTKLKGGLK